MYIDIEKNESSRKNKLSSFPSCRRQKWLFKEQKVQKISSAASSWKILPTPAITFQSEAIF